MYGWFQWSVGLKREQHTICTWQRLLVSKGGGGFRHCSGDVCLAPLYISWGERQRNKGGYASDASSRPWKEVLEFFNLSSSA